jgi:glutathione S-transferase
MAETALRLYELVVENGRSSSPFVWRIRYALAHKGLAFEPVPLGFTDIPKVLDGRFKTVPILGHGAHHVEDSWEIAAYLDRTFPERPLFSSAAEHATVRLCDEWQSAVIMRKLFAMYVLDIYNAVRPADRAYFRASREKRLKGVTLEEYSADRLAQREAVREAMGPWRAQLTRHPFLGGSAPTYADYIALGAFHWVASVSTLPLLAANDETLRAWLERGLDLYGGIGRDPRMKPLFE